MKHERIDEILFLSNNEFYNKYVSHIAQNLHYCSPPYWLCNHRRPIITCRILSLSYKIQSYAFYLVIFPQNNNIHICFHVFVHLRRKINKTTVMFWVKGYVRCLKTWLLTCAIQYKMPRLRIGLCPALTPVIMEKLSRIGVHNVVDVLIMDLDELSQKSKVSYKVLNYHSLFTSH